MPANTATQGLTYPLNTDLLREQHVHHRVLAEQLELRFGFHTADLERTRMRPGAIIRATATQTLNLTSGNSDDRMVKFDTVEVDTAGFVDLSRDARYIDTSSIPGWYHIGGYVVSGPVGGSNQYQITVVNGESMTGEEYAKDSGTSLAPGIGNSVGVFDRRPAGSEPVSLQVNHAGTSVLGTATIYTAMLWAYWESDL